MNLKVKAPQGVNIRSGPGTDYEVIGVFENGRVFEPIDTATWTPFIMSTDAGGVTFGWVSAKYVVKSDVVVPTPKPLPPTGEPAWIKWARGKIGVKELPGAGDNPEIVSWFKLTTLPPDMWHDSTAWCGVFVSAALSLNGVKNIGSARAVDWLEFGKAVDTPQVGDVTVFDWGGGAHHVCFYLNDADSDHINCLGGNQSDAVTINKYPREKVMGFRRPV